MGKKRKTDERTLGIRLKALDSTVHRADRERWGIQGEERARLRTLIRNLLTDMHEVNDPRTDAVTALWGELEALPLLVPLMSGNGVSTAFVVPSSHADEALSDEELREMVLAEVETQR
jgi:hypothetical protein